MKESAKLELIKAALEKAPASTRSQRIRNAAELANIDRMIELSRKKELAQEAKV